MKFAIDKFNSPDDKRQSSYVNNVSHVSLKFEVQRILVVFDSSCCFCNSHLLEFP